jgi:hypothetical protein
MPQVQMIQFEKDPGAEAMRSVADSIRDSVEKKHQFEIMKQELVIKAKMANTEEEKARIDRQKLVLDSAAKAFDQGIFKNPQSAQAWIRMTSNNLGSEAFDHLSAFGESVAGMQSPQADLQQAQVGSEAAQGKKYASESALMDQIRQGMSGGGGQGGSGGPIITGGNVGGIQWANPEAAAKLRYDETKAGQQATQDVATQPVKRLYTQYKDYMGRAVKEMSGLGSSAAEAYVKGTSAQLNAMVGNMPGVQAAMKAKQAMALAGGSLLNKGRPTEMDALAADNIIPDVKYTEATNKALEQFWDAILQAPDDSWQSKEALYKSAELLKAEDKKFMDWAASKGIKDMNVINSELDKMHKQRGL